MPEMAQSCYVYELFMQGRSQDFYCGGGGLKPPRCRDQEMKASRCRRCLGGRDVPLPSEVGSGEGAVHHPQKFFEVFCVK